MLKYTRLKEFGIDRPSFLIMYFIIFFYLKNFYNNTFEYLIDKKISLLIYLSVFVFFIKITYFFIGLLPLFLIFKYNRFQILKSFELLPIYLIIFTYLIKNILISGCLIYPIPSTCIEFISWNTKDIAEKWYVLGEILNKAWWKYEGNYDELTYIKNFNWFKTWFYSVKIELLEFLLTAFLALIFTIFSFKKKLNKLSKKEIIQSKNILNIFLIIFVVSLSLFIFKLPVIRMAHYLFIFISILLLMKFYTKFSIYPNKFTILTIIVFSISFNGYKNLLRISKENFKNDPYQIIEPLKSKQVQRKLGNFTYFTGWYGNYPAGNKNLSDTHNHKKFLIFDIIYKKN